MCAAWAIAFGIGAVIVLFAIAREKSDAKPRSLMTTATQNFFIGTLTGFALGLTLAIARSA